jgi:opacity protein-like surface antigen
MIMSTKHIAMLSGLCLMFAVPAAAQGQASTWYAGVGVGQVRARFQPDYKTLAGGEDQQFINEADGLQVDVIAGRRRRLGHGFSLGYQGTFTANRARWTLSIPAEPATFQYSLSSAVIASVVPELHLVGLVSIFGEVGGGAGRTHQIKTASPYSTYEYDAWRGAAAAGGGVRVKVSACVDLVAAFRQVRYAGYEFDTFNPQGVHVEHVKESPRARGFSIGFTTSF